MISGIANDPQIAPKIIPEMISKKKKKKKKLGIACILHEQPMEAYFLIKLGKEKASASKLITSKHAYCVNKQN